MKPLLNKTTKPFLIFVLIVLSISIPVYYYMVDAIWLDELDEHNEIVAEKTEYEFNRLPITEHEIERNLALWNKIQPGTNIEKINLKQAKKDHLFTVEKYKPFSADPKIERYRVLEKVIYIKGKHYLFTIETNIEETEDTVMIIGLVTGFFFLLIVGGLFVLNRRLSKTIWKPFRKTLNQLKNFNLNAHTQIEFENTDTIEFNELNESLLKLISQNIAAYKTQKEFTENASHELQTPLAIIKNKLDILLQDKNLTEKQYNIVEDMNRALTRSARINQNLLLLAKIENSQFSNSDTIYLDQVIRNCIDNVQDHFEQKNINLQVNLFPNIILKGNLILTEILINNLLLNAIRHNPSKGSVAVTLNATQFSVTNSGLQELNQQLIFKRFSKQAANNKGSGLGLAIVKEIAKSQNWEVDYVFNNSDHIFSVRF